jgi:hypothetical protein
VDGRDGGRDACNARPVNKSMMGIEPVYMSDRFQWARLLAFVTGLVNQELLLRNEYLAAENRIVRAHLPSRLRLSERNDPPGRDRHTTRLPSV